MNDRYDLVNTGAQVQTAVTEALSVFPNQINSLENTKVTKVSGKGLSSEDYTTQDKNKVARINITGDGLTFLANDGTYKSASAAINYEEILNKPILNTSSSTSLSVSDDETLEGTISLHRISKTGSYSDLIDTPIIPDITLNNNIMTSPNFYAPTTAGTSSQYLSSSSDGIPTWTQFPAIPEIRINNTITNNPNFYAPTTGGTANYYLKAVGTNSEPVWAQFPIIPTITLNGVQTTSPSFHAPIGTGNNGDFLMSNGNDIPTWESFPAIPNVGNLNTTSNTSLNTNSSESFKGNISLHKISKTGNYNDLVNSPIISYIGSEDGPVILASLEDGTYSISGYYKNNYSVSTVNPIVGSLLVNKSGNKIVILNGDKTQVNYNVLNETTWTTQTSNLVKANSFDSIVVVNDYPTTMLNNVLYIKVEAI